MRPKSLLPVLLATYSPSALCDDAMTASQAQPAPPVLATADANNRFTTPAQPLLALPARQHAVAARTTSPVPDSITALPTPAPASDGDGVINNASVENTSTTTITITSRSTTTIRPTLTITSLFSSIGPTTSGGSGRLEPLMMLSWE
ncbi:hypothetical protein GGS24DRAFT_503174 [Hypoxylon argillaceum]|nr:hypothetical protein GGS24DRAFT_503174 [Hypoxylon argillaceum]KAI1151563.1 hypothetical protein F4825DRAFT_451359 [Nemania diffusa]